MRSPFVLLILSPLLLAGCDRVAPDTETAGISAEDARALDRAAERLDAQKADPPLFPEKESEGRD